MNCSACGSEIPDGTAFCPACGAAKVGMEAAPGMTDGTAATGAAPEPGEDSDGGTLGRMWAAVRSTLSK